MDENYTSDLIQQQYRRLLTDYWKATRKEDQLNMGAFSLAVSGLIYTVCKHTGCDPMLILDGMDEMIKAYEEEHGPADEFPDLSNN